MIQKKLIIAIAIIAYSIGNLNAQIINVNPNPDGEPWISGGTVSTFGTLSLVEVFIL